MTSLRGVLLEPLPSCGCLRRSASLASRCWRPDSPLASRTFSAGARASARSPSTHVDLPRCSAAQGSVPMTCPGMLLSQQTLQGVRRHLGQWLCSGGRAEPGALCKDSRRRDLRQRSWPLRCALATPWHATRLRAIKHEHPGRARIPRRAPTDTLFSTFGFAAAHANCLAQWPQFESAVAS